MCCSVLCCVVWCCVVLCYTPRSVAHTHIHIFCEIVLQCVAMCCSVLQHVAVCCQHLPKIDFLLAMSACPSSRGHIQRGINCVYTHVCKTVLQCVAVCCSVFQCAAVCCSVLQRISVCCSVLQCVAVCCSVLQTILAWLHLQRHPLCV